MLYKQHLIAVILSKGIISSSPLDKLMHEELRGLAQGHSPSQRRAGDKDAAPGGRGWRRAMPCLPRLAPAAQPPSPERRSAAGPTNEPERGG